METEMKETADKLRKSMEQSARLQSEHMTAKEQLSTLEKAKVCVFGGFKTVVRLKPFSKEFLLLGQFIIRNFPLLLFKLPLLCHHTIHPYPLPPLHLTPSFLLPFLIVFS